MKKNSKLQIVALFFALLFSINAKSQCVANFSYTLGASGNVSFTNLSTNTTSNTSFWWTFGDATSTIQPNPNHTYGGNGSYVVTLILLDSTCSSSYTQAITVSNAVCALNAGYTFSVNANGLVNFYNTTTGTVAATSYTLNYGDNNFTGFTSYNLPSHTYTSNGSFLVVLTANNASTCVNTYSTLVNLSTVVPCSLTANFTYTITNGTVNFSNTSTGTSSNTVYNWNFGNSNTFYGPNPPTQTYPSNGQYFVSLNVNDSSSCNSLKTQTLILTNAPCIVNSNFSMSKDSSITSSIVWNAYPYYPSNVTTVLWNWGDNSTSSGLYPSHTYSATGFYNICLTVSVSCGSSTTTCLNTNIFRGNNTLQMASVNVINLATGIKNNSTEAVDVRLYPNPAKDLLTIESSLADYSISITDLYGKVIYTKAHSINDSKIDLQNFNAGIYFVKISGANYNKSIKLIKD